MKNVISILVFGLLIGCTYFETQPSQFPNVEKAANAFVQEMLDEKIENPYILGSMGVNSRTELSKLKAGNINPVKFMTLEELQMMSEDQLDSIYENKQFEYYQVFYELKNKPKSEWIFGSDKITITPNTLTATGTNPDPNGELAFTAISGDSCIKGEAINPNARSLQLTIEGRIVSVPQGLEYLRILVLINDYRKTVDLIKYKGHCYLIPRDGLSILSSNNQAASNTGIELMRFKKELQNVQRQDLENF